VYPHPRRQVVPPLRLLQVALQRHLRVLQVIQVQVHLVRKVILQVVLAALIFHKVALAIKHLHHHLIISSLVHLVAVIPVAAAVVIILIMELLEFIMIVEISKHLILHLSVSL
jgi:hypothetical protein